MHPFHAADYVLTPPTVELVITGGAGNERFTIATLPNGEAPRNIVVQTGFDPGYPVAIGDSTIDATTDPQFFCAEGQDPVIIRLHPGQTHIAVDGTAGSGAVTCAPTGDF